jgi:hypothetical protein
MTQTNLKERQALRAIDALGALCELIKAGGAEGVAFVALVGAMQAHGVGYRHTRALVNVLRAEGVAALDLASPGELVFWSVPV